MNKTNGNVEISYAYLKSGTDEISVAGISLIIGNEDLLLLVEVNETIANNDFELLLTHLQNQPFNKMRLSIARDCKVVLKQPKGEYTVTFVQEAEDIKIAGIIPVER